MGEEGAIAPHHGIMIPQDGQYTLVKRAAVGYHGSRLLVSVGEWYLSLCHGASLLPNRYIMLKPTLYRLGKDGMNYRFSGHETFPCRYAWLPNTTTLLR